MVVVVVGCLIAGRAKPRPRASRVSVPPNGLVKFYVYIADGELDSILAALTPQERSSLARDLSVDPELLELATTRRSDPDETRFARATAVAAHLKASGAAAGLDGDARFIADQGAVRWGRLRCVRGRELIRHESESPVSFGFTRPTRELIMSGSPSKLLAQPSAATIDLAAQAQPAGFPWFVLSQRAEPWGETEQRSLDQVFEATPPPDRASDAPSWAKGTPKAPRALSAHTLGTLRTEPWMERLAVARAEANALPEGRLEFLARRVATFYGGQVDPATSRFEPAPAVVIGVPLCIAMIV